MKFLNALYIIWAMKYTRFESLPVWNSAIELSQSIYQLTSTAPLNKRKNFCDQLERASLSISNNIAEGFERGTTNELLSFLYIARGSAGEVRSMLCLLERLEPDLKSQITELKKRCEEISRQLYGWIESLKNSEIQGQRRLDDNQRKRFRQEKEKEEFLKEMRRLCQTPQKGIKDK